jgi:peptide/nickel transport system substrate-binding protein
MIQRVLQSLVVMGAVSANPMLAKDVVIAWESAPRTVDTRYAVDADSQYLENLLNCSLIGFSAEGKVVGDLAKSWTWVNPTTLKLELQANAKFSDGKAVTAEDVKATYDFFKRSDVKPPSPRAGAFAGVESVSVEKSNVVFKLKEADASFITNLVIGVLPKDLAATAILATDKAPVGCGPFVLKSYGINGITLEKNPHYTLGQTPKVNQVQIKIVKDETTRFAKLKAGELNIVQNLLSRDKVMQISKNQPQLKVIKRSGLNTSYLGFNMKDPVLANAKVRLAIAHAIKRQDIIDYILKGLARPAVTMLLPEDTYFDKDLKPIAYDPTAAMKLLDEAGYKDPDGAGPKPRLVLTYKTPNNDTRISVARAIGGDLKKIGIEVRVQALEWGKFKDDVEKGAVQLWSLNWIGFKDPDIYRYAFATESFPPNGGNRGWYSNPELDKLLKEARMMTDEKKRQELYKKVQGIVQAELPYVFLWHEDIFAVTTSDIEGFSLYADGRFASLKNVLRK